VVGTGGLAEHVARVAWPWSKVVFAFARSVCEVVGAPPVSGASFSLHWVCVCDAKDRAHRLLLWRRGLTAHDDAFRCRRAASEGRPLELAWRLQLGHLAGGL